MKAKQINLLMVGLLIFVSLIANCGSDATIVNKTIATLSFIRPEITVKIEGKKTPIFESIRLIPNSEIETSPNSRSILILDSGVRVAVDEKTALKVQSESEISLVQGRIFISADENEKLKVGVENGKFEVSGSSVSIEKKSTDKSEIIAYTYSGELSYNFKNGAGVLRAGELVRIDSNRIATEPVELWNDWTGGMAQAGPQPMETPTSIGQIYARRPGSTGQFRFSLVIRKHEVRITVNDDIAVTETMQEFFNPESEIMEGIFRLRIPEDAILQRFAVDRNGRLIDGTIMERRTASQEYQSHVYSGSASDPALLEWMAPQSFKARIYPIKPGQTRTVVYTYTQWLKPSGKDGRILNYIYPIGNETVPPQIGEFYLVADVSKAGNIDIQASAGTRIEKGKVVFLSSDFKPRSDIYIQIIKKEGEVAENEVLMMKTDYRGIVGQIKGQRSETYVRTQFLIHGNEIELKPQKNLSVSIVLDMSSGTEEEMVNLGHAFLKAILDELNDEDKILVFAGDIETQILGQAEKKFQKATSQVKEAILEAASHYPTGGATDMGKLLMDAAAVASTQEGGIAIYAGDGFPTVGELDVDGLRKKLKKLPNPVRIYAVALGDEANLGLLSGICSGRGKMFRVTDIVDATKAANSILSDASVPVIENLTYEIDGGVQQIYPKEFPTLPVNEPVSIIGKLVENGEPKTLKLKGIINGKILEKSYKIKIKEIDDFGDLRMRWASSRLNSMMEAGEGPETMIELGTRFGIITPFTSFYVPPEEECSSYQESPPFRFFQNIDEIRSSKNKFHKDSKIFSSIIGILLPYGCSKKAEESERREVSQSMQPPLQYQTQAEFPSGESASTTSTPAKSEKMLSAAKGYAAEEGASAEPSLAATDSEERDQRKAMPEEISDKVELGAVGHGSGGSTPLTKSQELKNKLEDITSYNRTKIVIETENLSSTGTSLNISSRVKKCNEASLIPIEEKVKIWQERLRYVTTTAQIMKIFEEAKRNCEIKDENSRRAFARLVLGLLQTVEQRCAFYNSMKSYPSTAEYIKRKIISLLMTPEQIKTAIERCDASILVSMAEVEKMLSKIQGVDEKIAALKKFVALYPNDMELRMKLLEFLEEGKRTNEAILLARWLQRNPYSGIKARTAVGDFYMRIGLRGEAKRAFSEIVEFAPFNYEARKRVATLYMTYGWFDDSYRQFETLSQMAPYDDSALVFLAQSAILTGRVDEGLRILQKISHEEPSSMEKEITPSLIARLLASIRLAMMRADARKEGNTEKLKQTLRRGVELGIGRDPSAIKIVSIWNHPDAAFEMSIKLPKSEFSKTGHQAPPFQIDWFSDSTKPEGDVLVQVRRLDNSPVKVSKGTLIVIIDEGKDSEQLKTIEFDLTNPEKSLIAWSISPSGEIKEVPVSKTTPLPAVY